MRSANTTATPSILSYAIMDAGAVTDDVGTYWIDPTGGTRDDAFPITCDMVTDGGGWFVIEETTDYAKVTRSETDSTLNFNYSLEDRRIEALKNLVTEGRQDWSCSTTDVIQCPGDPDCAGSTYQLNWIVWDDGSQDQFPECQSPTNNTTETASGTSINLSQLPAREWHPQDCGNASETCQHNVEALYLR